MWTEPENTIYELKPVEVETLRRAAVHRGLPFDPSKSTYSKSDLLGYGMTREAFDREELKKAGITPRETTSKDKIADEARELFGVGTPFAQGIEKWQLPIDMMPFRPLMIVFPPKSVVTNHTHPADTADDPGGALRVVLSGSIVFRGQTFSPGEWFFVPNGTAYEFRSDETEDTNVMYLYRFFAAVEENRFSHPKGCD